MKGLLNSVEQQCSPDFVVLHDFELDLPFDVAVSRRLYVNLKNKSLLSCRK